MITCCQPECGKEAEFEIHTVRRNGGNGGPDPYQDTHEACQDHVGAMLGHQVGAVNPEQIYWEVVSL